ncbi:hypothetical protein AAG747_28675 [Rapidithrix thailandica]|uniref:Uncharacterized protein n=1 Tax=Rapidithrix thailandica TaxID=413964 RepID=A0AAW9SHG9_9BACT
MRHYVLLWFTLLSTSAFGQSEDARILEIKNVYKEVQEFMEFGYGRSLLLDDTGPGGGSTFHFYSEGPRLYHVKQEAGFEDGGIYQIEYYFNAENKPCFIYYKHDLTNESGGTSSYREDRVYISKSEVIKVLRKEMNDQDPKKLAEFIEHIDQHQNKVAANNNGEVKGLLTDAIGLSKIWKLHQGL